MKARNLRHLNSEEVSELLATWKQPAFRVGQLQHWLWKKHVLDFNEMLNLPAGLRAQLEAEFVIQKLEVTEQQASKDGTMKLAFRADDGREIEGVLIPAKNKDGGLRLTACVSSQAGCSLACSFCATAKLKMMRNLYPDEIFDQVMALNRLANELYGSGLTNIVFMGMGEPLLNYGNVMEAIGHISAPEGLGMSARRVTLSTAGIQKMIRKLADDKPGCKLALSLHSAIPEKRNRLMPITLSNSLDDLKTALRYYYKQTHKRVTYEYVLLEGENDTHEDAVALIQFSKVIPCKVNLIEYNPVEGIPHRRASYQRMATFQQWVREGGVEVSLRRSRGRDIDAACGQLANKRS
jgi:23S rRNA (adenine2503-C2)-methyltransferase